MTKTSDGTEEDQGCADGEGEPVLVFCRVSREKRDAAGDTVRIYRDALAYYIVWGEPEDVDFSSLDPVADPDDSLEAAMGWDDEFFVVRPDTIQIHAQMDRRELLERLKPKGAFLDHTVQVNGEPWRPGPTIDGLIEHGEMVFSHPGKGGWERTVGTCTS